MASESAIRDLNVDLVSEDYIPEILKVSTFRSYPADSYFYDSDNVFSNNKCNDGSMSPSDNRSHSTEFPGSSKYVPIHRGKSKVSYFLNNNQ